MFCSKCGMQNTDDSTFCGQCGANIVKPTVKVQNSLHPSENKKPNQQTSLREKAQEAKQQNTAVQQLREQQKTQESERTQNQKAQPAQRAEKKSKTGLYVALGIIFFFIAALLLMWFTNLFGVQSLILGDKEETTRIQTDASGDGDNGSSDPVGGSSEPTEPNNGGTEATEPTETTESTELDNETPQAAGNTDAGNTTTAANASAESAALAYADGLFGNDPELILSSFHPAILAEDGFAEQVASLCEQVQQIMEEGSVVVDSCEVVQVDDAEVDAAAFLTENYDWEVDAEELKTVLILVNGELNDTYLELYVVKIDGAWYALTPVE